MKHRLPLRLFALIAALAATPRAFAQVRLWTADLPAMEGAVPAEQRTLRPVAIIATRNGAFSGKVVLESSAPIQGARAALGPLVGPGGALPPAAAQVRFAVPFESGAGGPSGPEVLLEKPPSATVASANGNSGTEVCAATLGAPVWIAATPMAPAAIVPTNSRRDR